MDESSLQILGTGSEEALISLVESLKAKHTNSKSFPELKKDLTKQIIKVLFEKLDKSGLSAKCYTAILEAIRIFCRDQKNMEYIVTERALLAIIRHAGLEVYDEDREDTVTQEDSDNKVVVEAQKCLHNIFLNSQEGQKILSSNGCLEGIVQRLKTWKDPDLIREIKFLDMRLLFLMTALCTTTRPKLRQDLHGFSYLLEALDLGVHQEDEKLLTDEEIDLACEIIKVQYNILISIDKQNLTEEEEAHYQRLVSVLHDILLIKNIESKDKQEELISRAVELLICVPYVSYEELLTPVIDHAASGMDSQDVEFEGKNMEAIVALLDILDERLKNPQPEKLSPILTTLSECCMGNRFIRKFCRQKILPYLRCEVKNLPEEGTELRNKLCKLLTNPNTHLKLLSANLLFVLCKEKVQRFVKYTGYGNAAGLLAQRGLMAGGRGETHYSSESEESDTEEYSQLRDSVNPITGRWEEDHPDPMEGMTDEQKEHEAMKLVDQLDRLQRQGIIQPTRIGEDGKPVPIDHILQLAENINIADKSPNDGE